MKHGWLATQDNDCLIKNVLKTTSFLERTCGLLFRPQLGQDDALLIEPCSSIHTLGMRYTIDIVYLDKTMKILKLVSAIGPWRMSACRGANAVLELAANRIAQLQLVTGQQLIWQEND